MAAPPFDDLSHLPRERLQHMQRAADELYALLVEFHAAGAHPVTEVLAASQAAYATFTPYPEDGVGSAGDAYAWYYHAHDATPDRPWLENGHFHCFAMVDHLRDDVQPWAPPIESRPDNRSVAHLVALCVSPVGTPERLFTLNRWASDECLYPADDIIPLIDAFAITEDTRLARTSQCLSAILRLLQPQISWLLRERDQVLRAAQEQNPAGFSEDASIEITSMLTFDLDDHLAALERALTLHA